jgi:hypothetical protein
MNYHYLDEQSREIGPVSLENLKAFRAAGVVKDQTLVRPEGGGPWAACAAVVGPSESSNPAITQSPAAKAVSGAVDDAKAALALLWRNPVGGLAPAYEKLGAKRAGAAGVVFVVAASAVYLWLLRPADFAGLLTLLFATIASFVAWAGALALARLAVRRAGSWEGDLFIAGSMSLGWVLALLLMAVVGWHNIEVVITICLAMICLTVLQVFAGLTRISGLTEQVATLAVPLVLIAGGWINTIIFRAIH